jgi:hypothetical protein
MADITKYQDTAKLKIEEYGSSIIIKKPSSSSYDVGSGTTVVTPGAENSIKGLIESFDINEIDGQAVKSTDLKIMVANLPFDIVPESDTLVKNGLEYNILRTTPLEVSNGVIYSYLQCRR